MSGLRLERISRSYPGGRVAAVRDVSLSIQDGEFVVLVGPSGCGKTTLLRTIAGLEHPDSGRVFIGERDVTELPPRHRNIAMVFQSYAVFPHLTVFDNVAFGLRMQKRSAAEIRGRVEQACAMLQLEAYLGRYPAQLSGGQRQRVAVARAIVMQPSVLLMDEPLSNLDALLRLQFRAELKKLVNDVHTTTLYVTHDQLEAMSLGDRIGVMREGALIQVDAPMVVYEHPATDFVGSFIGSPPMNFLRGTASPQGLGACVRIGTQSVRAPSYVLQVGDVLLGIRAEDVRAFASPPADSESLAAETLVVEPLGAYLLVTATVAGQVLKVTTRTDFPARAGMPIWLAPEPDRIRWHRAADGTALAP